MKASKLIRARSSENGVIVLEGLMRNKIRYIGSSIAKSVPCDNEVNSVMFSLKEGDKGFVAIRAINIYSNNNEAFSFFLPVEWLGSMPFIDLESAWTPPYPDRLGVMNYSGLMTEIDGIIYTGNRFDKDQKGMKYVRDCNLLCKYLAGEVGADAVKAAAEYNEEENAKEKISELEKKIQKLTAFINEQDKLIIEKEKCLKRIMLSNAEREAKITAALEVVGEAKKQWFCRSSIKKAIKKYDDVTQR